MQSRPSEAIVKLEIPEVGICPGRISRLRYQFPSGMSVIRSECEVRVQRVIGAYVV